jgi:hypothetical protein
MREHIEVIAADELTKGLKDTTVIPNSILRSKISPPLVALWVHLWSYCYHDNYCFPSRKRIAMQMGCSLRSVCSYLDQLESLGLIRRTIHTEHGVSGYYIFAPSDEGKQTLPGGRAKFALGVRHR